MTVDETKVDTEESKTEGKGKTKAAFEGHLEKFAAVLKRQPDKKAKKKIPESALDELIKDLYKEEDETLMTEVKSDIKALSNGYINLNSEIAKKQKELDELIEKKQKEFNEQAQKVWNKIDDLPARLTRYKDAFIASAAEGLKDK